MKKLAVGIVAHVDAGKTTLSEALLYVTGKIKQPGRVDHRSSYLDTHELERERGITIFAKQAVISTDDAEIYLIDTPGHSDFSAETERTLQVLDYAIMVISGTDGVQAHTETLWRLLQSYGVPVFVFVTKMDLARHERTWLMNDLKKRLGASFVDFCREDSARDEEIATCDEDALEAYLSSGRLDDIEIARLVAQRRLFPCYFGSGLKLTGVDAFITGLGRFTLDHEYPQIFGARVFKIGRDVQGNRLTYMKITGGTLKVRMPLSYTSDDGSVIEEKVGRIRIYSGAKFEQTEQVSAGAVCAVLGLTCTHPGQGLGFEGDCPAPLLEPVLSYRVLLPSGCDERAMLPKLKLLEDEDPMLRVVWNEALREIHVQIMGRVQLEVLKSLIAERYDVHVDFDGGSVMYRETIAEPSEGAGHFEPLRHYAEVHLLLEPLERGSGLEFATICSEDLLDRNWQRLILTHLAEREHVGVLTGSPITDMRITLTTGRAHIKHTEGGDFRQATWRAVRQGLMKAQSVLLEPYYEFRLEIPPEQVGRAINDIRAMHGVFSSPEESGGMTALTGSAPVRAMRDYYEELTAYTHGRGRLFLSFAGYAPCRDAESVISRLDYDPERDVDNSPDSVFCAHGAGFIVKWDKADEYMHLESPLKAAEPENEPEPRARMRNYSIDDKELESIMEREFGPIRRRVYTPVHSRSADDAARDSISSAKEYYIVDGYNVIFAWDELKHIADENLDAARHRLMELLSNYRGYKKCELVLVFDAYKVKGGTGERFDYHGIHVAYTRQGETCDMYIERLAVEIGKNYSVRVVSSDSIIQLSALRAGLLRMSSSELQSDVEWVYGQIGEIIRQNGRHSSA